VLDDYVNAGNPMRVIDAFVDELDWLTLGFAGAQPPSTGRPAYRSAVMLEALRLWLSQSAVLQSQAGARGGSQRRTDVG
jgi:transposase